jgi:hypothetical protein
MPKGKRQPSFTPLEKEILLEEVEKEIGIIEDKRTENRINEKKKDAWKRVTEAFCSHSGVNQRTQLQLHNKWKSLKSD